MTVASVAKRQNAGQREQDNREQAGEPVRQGGHRDRPRLVNRDRLQVPLDLKQRLLTNPALASA